jgi:hypothetical protein
MTKMEVSWKYDIQNGYAKIIPPKIPDRISLMLINYNITTSNTRKDILILSYFNKVEAKTLAQRLYSYSRGKHTLRVNTLQAVATSGILGIIVRKCVWNPSSWDVPLSHIKVCFLFLM